MLIINMNSGTYSAETLNAIPSILDTDIVYLVSSRMNREKVKRYNKRNNED